MQNVARPPDQSKSLAHRRSHEPSSRNALLSPATKQDSRAWAKLLRSSRKLLHPNSLPGRAALVIVAIAFVIFGSRGLWKLVRSHVETRPEYQAAADNIEITPLPSWIHSDVKSEVIRDAGLPVAMSILDERTIDRLKQAFSLHPWVARVEGIDRSYPAHFKVDLTYRRPVAMVEVRGGLLPVDANAILLPTGDFSSAEAENYLRVSGSASSPLGPVGTAWGDPTIEAAAKLADLLQPASNDWLLQRIRIQSQIAANGVPILVLKLVTRSGTELIWGRRQERKRHQNRKRTRKLPACGN